MNDKQDTSHAFARSRSNAGLGIKLGDFFTHQQSGTCWHCSGIIKRMDGERIIELKRYIDEDEAVPNEAVEKATFREK